MNSFINFLKRNKLYSAVNLLGLSLSMAFVLLRLMCKTLCLRS